MAKREADKQLTRRELADCLDVVMQTVTKWEQAGMPVLAPGRKGVPSLYSEAAVRQWLAAREEAARNNGALDVARERARKEHAQALLAEQMYKARAGELLPRDEVEQAWLTEVAGARAVLIALPATYAARIHRASTLEGEAGVEHSLHDAVREVLRELSDPGRDAPSQASRRSSRKK